MIFVYAIHCGLCGEQYIGMTSQSLERRFKNHLSVARSARADGGGTTLLAIAIRKCGEAAFSIRSLATVDSRRQAEHLERLFISRLGTLSPGGLNTQGGGKRDYGLSEHGRRKIGAAVKAAALRRIAS